MSNPNDGGPAFPMGGGATTGELTWIAPTCAGMSLRDWFAGQALMSMRLTMQFSDVTQAAVYAYQMADAMLAERERGGEGTWQAIAREDD